MDNTTEVTMAILIPLLLLGLLCNLSLPGVLAQVAGFLYIDCGAMASYIDPITGIEWLPDAGYIETGENFAGVVDKIYPTLRARWKNFPELNTLRYFNDSRPKNCYSLPVTPNTTYLLRATFLYALYDNATNPPTFSMAIDGTIVVPTVYSDPGGLSIDDLEFTIQPLENNVTFLCLVRNESSSDSGVPYISSISLHPGPLYPSFDSYLSEKRSIRTRDRLNFGGNTSGRYPIDKYDRLWSIQGVDSLYLNSGTNMPPCQNLTSHQSVDINYFDVGPPAVIMETAITTIEPNLEIDYLDFGWTFPNISAYLVLYFAELDPSANVTSREFYVRVPSFPDLYENPWNATSTTGPFVASYSIWSNFTYNPRNGTHILLYQNRSTGMGPLINALEFFEITDILALKTNEQDALAIDAIKLSMNLTAWTGDPCLPVSHSWITCTTLDVLVHPQILAVNLSGYNLTGTISPSFSNLSSLTSLSFDNNALIGSLPDLSDLTNLKILHLQDNLLNGPLPFWLGTLTHLTELFVENNNFSGSIPTNLLSKNDSINFRYYPGNPLLENSTMDNAIHSKSSNIELVGIVVGCTCALSFVVFIFLLYNRLQHRLNNTNIKPLGAKAYSYAEILAAIGNFNKNLLGTGAFGSVFYGVLADKEVAIKINTMSASKEIEAAFQNEVNILSRVHHKYLVSLIGYCQEGNQYILIYEYIPNGTLSSHLYDCGNCESLNWTMRLNIALTVAQGLDYLHIGCNPSMIHRDIKSDNILLTNNIAIAKVADFGITKVVHSLQDAKSYNICGTPGYLDPEYFESGIATTKSDVYSFGVVLLELITGRKPKDKDCEGWTINSWVRTALERGRIDTILDRIVKASDPNMESVWKVGELAMQCVEPQSVHRPSMSNVIQELLQAIDIEGGDIEGGESPDPST